MDTPDVEFQSFRKIPRLMRDVYITEKIDGTNAQVYITHDLKVYAGSRNRWITPENDNFGFAAWVQQNQEELKQLGPGHHYGEWWGKGIQRGYGLDHRRFSLFNVERWCEWKPECCYVVPLVYRGEFDTAAVSDVATILANHGSRAAAGYMNPEGLIVYHVAANQYFKWTLDGDQAKG